MYVKDPNAYYFDAAAVDREPYMAPGLVTAEKAARGKLPTDVWWHTIVPTNGREKTGYPTQKPEGIVRRMVQASTRPGDWCLDFFAGSGTLGAVAAQLGRRYVLIDSNPEAIRDHARPPFEPRHASLRLMFHVELRHFPHNACAFNLSEAELHELIEPWSRDQLVELGERKWSPHQARLTVLEGPHLPVEDLAMGRGWGNAQHHSEDVTERVLAQVRASQPPGAAVVAPPPADGAAQEPPAASAVQGPPSAPTVSPQPPAADSPGGAQLRPLLGADPDALLQAWRLAAERRPELTPSESLALAEQTLTSLDAPRGA